MVASTSPALTCKHVASFDLAANVDRDRLQVSGNPRVEQSVFPGLERARKLDGLFSFDGRWPGNDDAQAPTFFGGVRAR
ncbi:MAG: hypothetical protein JRG70_16780 [Deltaproteobacteria bacterium]|nr:hypothetical protein [Deltaproteobacteria bacterium]